MQETQLIYKTRNYIHERDSYEPKWPQEEFIVPVLKHGILENLNIHLKSGFGKRVLDIGCGKQPFRKLIESFGCQYYGLDVQPHEDTEVDFICPIDQVLPKELVSSSQYDFILCTEVLEHVADWHITFQNLSHLVREGGKILITCPHFYQLHEEPYDFWRPTNHAIEVFARNYNFTVVHVDKAGTAWDVLGTWLANCRFCIRSQKIQHRIFYQLFSFLVRKLSVGLKKRELQQIVGVHSPLYLSNIVVLGK